jgi:hypothetical protein
MTQLTDGWPSSQRLLGFSESPQKKNIENIESNFR